MKLHDVKFPGESDEYRKRRNEILEDEIELRQHMERVAEKRRNLPLGGEVPKDYEFDTESGKLRISEMFRDGKDTLVLYSFMYSPPMDEPCPF
jgi:predicted dithiol-disulfide oxidoreductase (DUF899 family)